MPLPSYSRAITLFTSGSERGAPSCRQWHAAERDCNRRVFLVLTRAPGGGGLGSLQQLMMPRRWWASGRLSQPSCFTGRWHSSSRPRLSPSRFQGSKEYRARLLLPLLPLLHPSPPSSSFSILNSKAGRSYLGTPNSFRNWPHVHVQLSGAGNEPSGVSAPLKEAGSAEGIRGCSCGSWPIAVVPISHA